jgi:hypothetical protein
MTTLDDLRETFDAYAGNGLDVDLTVATAQAGATRIRRRRRTFVACVAAVLVAVAAVTPVALARLRSDRATPAATPSYRASSQLTVSLAAGTPYFVQEEGTDGHQQHVIVRQESPQEGSEGSVFVYDPGSYDGQAFAHGTPTTVSGHPATSVPDLQYDPTYLPEERAPAVGWKDASGAWVVVTQTKTVAEAIDLATAVRLGAPRAVTGPVAFTTVPGDRPLTFSDVEVAEKRPSGQTYAMQLGFGPGRAAPRSMPMISGDPGLDVTMMVQPVTGMGWQEIQGAVGGTEKTINGLHVRFVPDTGSQAFRSGPGGHILIGTDTCGIEIELVDLAKIPFAQAESMIAGMTVGNCTDTATWGPVVPQ